MIQNPWVISRSRSEAQPAWSSRHRLGVSAAARPAPRVQHCQLGHALFYPRHPIAPYIGVWDHEDDELLARPRGAEEGLLEVEVR